MKFIGHISINTKLVIGFGLIIVLQSITILTAYRALEDAGTPEKTLFDVNFSNVYDLATLRSNINGERVAVAAMIMTDKAEWGKWNADLQARIQKDEQIIDRLIIGFRSNPPQLSRMNEFIAAREKYEQAQAAILRSLFDSSNRAMAKQIFFQVSVDLHSTMRAIALSLEEEEGAEASRMVEVDRINSEDRARTYVLYGIATLAMALGLAAMMKWLLSSYIGEIRNEGAKLASVGRALKLLNVCNGISIRSKEEDQLLRDTCQAIIDVGRHKLAWVGYAENDESKSVRPVALAGADHEYVDTIQISWSDSERGRGPTGTAIRSGKPVVSQDTMTDTFFEPWRYEAVERGIRSSVAAPLRNGEVVFGALMVYSAVPHAFDGEELELLSELADNLAYATVAIREGVALANAEKKLRITLEKYRVLLDSINIGVSITDEKGRIVEANPASERLLGISTKDHTGRTIDGKEWKVIRPDGSPMPPEEYASVRALKEKRAVDHVEMGVVKSDSDVTWMSVNANPIPLEGYGVAITYTDITERKNSEHKLEKANAYNRSILEASSDPIVVIDIDGKIVDLNKATEAATGYCRAELIGTEFADYFTDPQRGREGVSRTLARGSVSGYQLTLSVKSGEKTEVLFNARVFRDEDGKLQGVVASARTVE